MISSVNPPRADFLIYNKFSPKKLSMNLLLLTLLSFNNGHMILIH